MVRLRDPERCDRCNEKGRIVAKERGQTRAGVVYVRRRHECRMCINPATGKLNRWTSQQSLLKLRLLRLRAS